MRAGPLYTYSSSKQPMALTIFTE